MVRRSLIHLSPSTRNLRRIQRTFTLLRPIGRLIFLPFFRVSTTGAENIPRRGPLLVLSNHAGFFDPVVLMMAIDRPIQFLATPSAIKTGLLGYIMIFFGAVPKKKFFSDIRAIWDIKSWCEKGAVIGVFPEGQRTWDSRQLQIVSGIGKLIRILGAPVVTARIINADRQSPRWAIKQRRGRIHVELDSPRFFSSKMNIAELEAKIQRDIYVDPDKCPRWPVTGKNLALGITNILFMCPSCFRLETLDEHHNEIHCCACDGRWTVGSDNRLTSHETGSRFSLLSTVDRMRQHFKQQNWVADPERFEHDGVILESEEMKLLDITDDYSTVVGCGRLQLTEEQLTLVGTVSWSLSLTDLIVATVDLRRQLQFRTATRLFGAIMPGESVVKWDWFTNHWRSVAVDRME